MTMSTETLLTIIVVMLSVLVMIAIVGIIVVAVSVNRLLKKVHQIADTSNESVTLLKQKLLKKIGLAGILKLLLKIRK